MGNTTSMNLRVDKELKRQAETLFAGLGINMTTAINIFLKQSVRDQAIPFIISANKTYESIPAYRGDADRYDNYSAFVAESLRVTDKKVTDGDMKYYTVDEIGAKLEDALNDKV